MDILINRDLWEVASYIVTVFGLPFAIFLFVYEQRKDRDAEDEEAYQLLQDAYNDFLKIVLANPDLQLRSASVIPNLSDEQRERKLIIYELLIALFERAYIVAYEPNMKGISVRRWASWRDYIASWVRLPDVYNHLSALLQGEDPEFAAYIRELAEQERAAREEPAAELTVSN